MQTSQPDILRILTSFSSECSTPMAFSLNIVQDQTVLSCSHISNIPNGSFSIPEGVLGTKRLCSIKPFFKNGILLFALFLLLGLLFDLL